MNIGYKRRGGFNVIKSDVQNFTVPILQQINKEKQQKVRIAHQKIYQAELKKFKHLRKNNRLTAPVINKKDQQLLEKLSDIKTRNGMFYRVAFKTHQRKSIKKICRNILQLDKSETKRTFNITDLWPNSITKQFLKQNRILFNKNNFINRINNILKVNQQQQLVSIYTSQNINSERMNTTKSFPLISTSTDLLQSNNILGLAGSSINQIKKRLKDLRSQTEDGQITQCFKSLEKQGIIIQKIKNRYKSKMLIII